MKKVSTAATKQINNFGEQKLTDRVGPGRSIELVLPVGWIRRRATGTEVGDDSESHAGSVRRHAAEADRPGNRDAFPVDQPAIAPIRARGGACAQRAFDWGESKER